MTDTHDDDGFDPAYHRHATLTPRLVVGVIWDGIAPELVGGGTRLRLPLIDSCIAVHELNASIAQAGRNVLHAHELIFCRSLGRQGVRRPYVFHATGGLIVDLCPADFPVVGHGGNCSIQTCAPCRSRRLRELLASIATRAVFWAAAYMQLNYGVDQAITDVQHILAGTLDAGQS